MTHPGRPYFGLDIAMKDGTPPLGGELGEAGYTTFHSGKCHNGRMSVRRSFQSGRSIMFSGMSDHRTVPVTGRGRSLRVQRRAAIDRAHGGVPAEALDRH
jgi:hypothetical protein